MKRDAERKRDDASYRLDMIAAADRIKARLRGITRAAFMRDDFLQDAIQMPMVRIVEAATNFTEAARQQYPDIPWHQIAGMRRFLVHVYWATDPEAIWSAAVKDVPDLARALRSHTLKKTSTQLDDEIARVLQHDAPKGKRRRRR